MQPYEIGYIIMNDHIYIENEDMNAFGTGLFIGYFKDNSNKVWSVSLEPDELKQMHNHSGAMKCFQNMGLHNHYKMLPCGVDVKQCQQLLTMLNEEGGDNIENETSKMVDIKVTEDLI